MKQTNNAIKFLMAQYRAIFKNAYFKGMATALVLTAGLAAGAAQANTGYVGSGGWTLTDDDYPNMSAGSYQLAGQIAGDALTGSSPTIVDNKKTDTAEGGTLVIGKYDPNGSVMGTGFMGSGTAAGNWVSSTDFDARAIGGLVTVNGSGYVDKGNQSARGVIYGARAYSTNGYAEAIGNEVHVRKDEVALNKAAASETIYGARVQGNTGALGSENKVFIDGRSATARQVVSMSGDGLFGVQVRASGTSSTGEYEASSNEVILNYIDVTDESNTLAIRGGHVRLAGSSGTGIADSNYIELNNSNISASGGMVYANHVTNGASNSTISLNGNGRGVSISDTTIYNAADSDFLAIAANTVEGSGGVVTASNGRVELANTKITASGGTNVTVYGSNIVVSGAANANLTASNNIVNITEADADSTNSINASVIGAHVENTTNSDKLTLAASNNSVSIGENVDVTGNVYGASIVAKSGANVTSLTAENNSVSIAGKVEGYVFATNVSTGDRDTISGDGVTTSFLNNDVNLLAGAEVSVGSLVGGEGKDSVIDIADGSTYKVNSSLQQIISDVVNINGKIDVDAQKKLSIAGFVDGGVFVDDVKFNKNLTTVGSTAEIHNKGDIEILGKVVVEQGATLTAETAGAGIFVDGKTDTDGKSTLHSDKDLKENAVEGAGYGTLAISNAQLKSYLTRDIVLDNKTKDQAGSLVLTQGGRLEFTDATDLADFQFKKGSTAEAGSIVVDDNSGANIISGNEISISKALAGADKKPLADELNLKVTANTLNLGSSTLAAADSAKIKFKEARARDAINFDVKGNDSFILTSDVVADRKFFDQQIVDKAEINTTTLNSNGNGTITGDVTIGTEGVGGAAGNLSIKGGAWTSNSNIAVVSGGLSVGAKAADGPNPTTQTYTNNGNPASLTLTGTLNINGANASVSVTGQSGADATLDLTGADVKWNAGTVTVSGSPIGANNFNTEEAKDYYADNSLERQVGYGKLLLNREDFNEFLVQTPAQTKLNIASGGYVHVNGSVTGSYDFDKFGTTPSDGVVAFTGAGTLDIDGEFNVVEAAEGADNTFDIGAGTIKANIISINTEDKDRDENPEAITLAGGTLEVEQGFSTNSSEFTIAGDDEHSAALVLAAGLEHTGSLTMGGTSGLLTVGNNAQLKVENGTWANDKIDLQVTGDNGDNVQEAAVVVGSYDGVLIKQAQDLSTDENTVYVASLQADNFAGEGSGVVLSVGEQSSATFNTMQLAGDAVVNVDGYLKVEGRNDINDRNDPAYVNAVDGVSSTAGINFEQGATIIVDGVGSTFELGEKATQALVTIDSTVTDATKNKYVVDEVLSDANIDVFNFGELKINLSADQTLTKADAAYLTTTLLGSNNYNGYLNVGAADLGITFTPDANSNDTVAWDDIEDFANITAGGTTSQNLKYALVTGIASANDRIQGHYGALQVTTGNTSALQVVGPLSLHNAADFGGKFVFRGDYLNGTTTAADIVFAQNASLALEDGGEIGSITGYGSYDNDYGVNSVQISAENGATTTVNGSITKIDELVVDGNTTVTDSIAVNFLDLAASLNTTAENGSVHVNDAAIAEGATLTTNAFTIGNANGYRANDNLVHVMGYITTGDLTLNENAELDLFGGVVTAKNLTASATSDISVGYDPLSTIVEDDPDTIYDDTKAYTGSLEITGQTKLNGAELYVDPEYGDHTALVSLNKLSGWTNASPRFEGGVLDGSVFVGRNSALGIGSDSLATLQSKIARFQNGVSLEDPQANPDGVGAVLYLGNSFTLGAGESLWLTALTTEGVREYYNANNGTLADISSTANLNVLADTVYLGENTAIVVDAGVLENSSAMITLAGTNGNASVIADGGDIYIDGNVRASTYQVFSGAKIKYIDGSDYAVTEDSEKNINVSTINDFLQGVVDEQGKVTLGVAHNGRAIMHGASDPVYESLLAYVRGYNGPEVKQEVTEEQPAEQVNPNPAPAATTETPVTDLGIQGVEDSRELYSYNDKGEKVYGQYSNYLLQETIATGDGSAAETVARLAVFGGAAQAAISAGASTYDAVSGRMGVGANGANITVADNTQGAALWLAPIYKSSDSDGFDAEGVDYGVDMDLYGVALGADYTLSNGIRFGAMFNVGSGDVDGQGAGSAVSNDFDYYGFAVYGGYSMGALSVVADVSYTVADNDLEGNTSIDKVGASLDSTNLSVGVTGQYQLDLNGTTVTPHAGLRFSRIDLDDYTVDGEDIIADYDADSMNIFSIPVGVTFAKEFTGDAWTVKPSLDLTLTGNFGDDETDGTVHWAGVDNLSTNVSSEVIDNFTYGATLGVAAKTGNFSLGLGVNYTGSSNVDEFGVQANARFVF